MRSHSRTFILKNAKIKLYRILSKRIWTEVDKELTLPHKISNFIWENTARKSAIYVIDGNNSISHQRKFFSYLEREKKLSNKLDKIATLKEILSDI